MGKTLIIAELYDKTTQKTIQVANCHLGLSVVGQLQVEKLQEVMMAVSSKYPIDLRIIAGTFNSDENDYDKVVKKEINTFSKIIENDYLTDCDTNKSTFLSLLGKIFDPSKHVSYSEDSANEPLKRKTDWIFAKPTLPKSISMEENKSLFNYQRTLPLSQRASNHYLVGTKIIFNDSFVDNVSKNPDPSTFNISQPTSSTSSSQPHPAKPNFSLSSSKSTTKLSFFRSFAKFFSNIGRDLKNLFLKIAKRLKLTK